MKVTITKAIALKHIFDNIIVNPATGCWEWQGSKTRDGYGQLSKDPIARKFGAKGVHRLAKILIDDWVPASVGEQTRHVCHNRACCNPDHMLTGSAKDNADDRGRRQLSADDVRTIRADRKAGVKTRLLAERFSVSMKHIQNIVAGRARPLD